MSYDLVIATYATELKNIMKPDITDWKLLELLYDAVAGPLNLRNKVGEVIVVSTGDASKIMNRTANMLKSIRTHIADSIVSETIVYYFQKTVLPKLQPALIPDLIRRLTLLIKKDENIAPETRDALLAIAHEETLAKFLSATYQYCAPRDNRAKKKGKPANNVVEIAKNKPLPVIPHSDEIGVNEKKYTNALLEVYGELENNPEYTFADLNEQPKHRDHFNRQREDYFTAEALRRGTRDIYAETDVDEFQVLKDEIYAKVIDTWEDNYPTGKQRLNSVLEKAVTPVTSSLLVRETVWFGARQAKGICHMLVNEDALKGWVRHD